MRTTKKILASVLAVCMLASTGMVSGFAATADDAVGGNTVYSTAHEAIDAEYTYDGELGAIYSPERTVFKVWSPTATEVTLNRYATGSDYEDGAKKLGTVTMEKLMDGDKWTGVWTATVEGDIVNTYYTYSITSTHPYSGEEQTAETQDVYSQATGVNGRRSMVVDLDKTDPDGWDSDKHILLDQNTDSYVWELHVKDFSWDENSGVSEQNRGKFLAFTETGTTLGNEGTVATCVDYLKQLGVTTVQLNPFYDFQSINERGEADQFNWGYDPQNYNVPEGSYSSNPYDGNVRINECKQMIQALHNAGIAVVMDVVYNHTYSCDKDDSCFQASVPDYYYRMNKDGTFSNGSGCGNEVATERAMARKYVIESCRYWVDEYHVDGFRFDLMGLMDVETMNLIRDNLDEVDPRITTWGEGWTGGTSNYPSKTCTGATFKQSTQANASSLNERMAFFNDKIRDGIKGSVFDIHDQGFIAGNAQNAKHIYHGVRANSNASNGWKAKAPSQTVTYADCHDNATLYDQIVASNDFGAYGEKYPKALAMNKLAAAIEFTSQGVLFNLAGQEFARTKYGDTNSYKSAASINQITWNNLADYGELVSYYKGLAQIRKHFSPFTEATKKYDAAYIFNTTTFSNPSNMISFTIENDTPGEWKKVAVLYNSFATPTNLTLKDTSVTDWVIIANDKEAGVTKLSEVTGSKIRVGGYSAVIAVDKESFEATKLDVPEQGVVNVNYLYADGTQLADSVTLKGEIGTGYKTSPLAAIPNTYVLDRAEGEETGVFASTPKTVNYYFTDYVPESIKTFADINQDGKIDVADVTAFQLYLAELEEIDPAIAAGLDLNYDGKINIADATMLQCYIADMPVSTGNVTVNYIAYDKDGKPFNLTDTYEIEGRVGDDFVAPEFKVMGYWIDKTKYPEITEGKIPYGAPLVINYYYTVGSLDVKLHVKHSGEETWEPYLWLWGSNLEGADSGNYFSAWPGQKMTDEDSDGWCDYNFTYKGTGTYNLIISNNGSPQSQDYKGFVDNEIWMIIDDAKVAAGSQDFLKFYTYNPETEN